MTVNPPVCGAHAGKKRCCEWGFGHGWSSLLLLWMACCGNNACLTAAPAVPDPRHLNNGWVIPSEGYADQPYIVKTDDGAWLCVMTTG